MRQRNSPKGKPNFSEKRSSSRPPRDGKPAFKKEGGAKRSFGRSRDDEGFDKKPAYKRDGGYGDKPKRSYGSDDKRPAFKKREGDFDRPKRSYGDDDKRPAFKKRDGDFDRPKRSYGDDDKRSSFKKRDGDFDRPKRSYGDDKPFKKEARSFDKPERAGADKPKRSYTSDSKGGFTRVSASEKSERSYDDKPKRSSFKKEEGYAKRSDSHEEEGEKKHRRSKRSFMEAEQEQDEPAELSYKEKKHLETFEKLNKKKPKASADGLIRLNRYIANAGICSRREADVLIASGVVTVNGKVVTEMGHKVKHDDVVTYDGAAIKNEDKKYLLLNKPKDYITTMDDPEERKTVMELIKGACRERLYPVGRLDRNTTGLLLFTNDGDMAAKLTHPKHNIRKVYHVTINKKITPDDYKKIVAGIELEDGFIKPDAIEFVEEGKKDLGIEIHSGRNRIVRRIFEHLGYEVVRLDRVAFAGLTKKDVPRGKWRFLSTKEVSFLKMLK